MTDPAKYFADSYAKARSLFSEAATAENAALGSMAHPLQGPDGEALATDLAWVGPRDAERLLITISATHGVEGYCGSGVQAGSLSAGRYRDLPEGLAVLIRAERQVLLNHINSPQQTCCAAKRQPTRPRSRFAAGY